MTPDVNVLVAAYRADHAHHDAAYAWLAEARRNCAQGSDTFTLLPMVATRLVKILMQRPDGNILAAHLSVLYN